ncbi:NAD(P)H-quinone oxidoreductase subunit O [Gloeomargarita sp.]
MAIKKGGLVRVIRERLENSLEAQANDTRWSAYVFESPAEVLDIRGDYVQLKFPVPTPPVWLRLDQVEACA